VKESTQKQVYRTPRNAHSWHIAKALGAACLGVTLCGCASLDWATAQKHNTVREYESFLVRYPDSSYTTAAQQRILQLDWQAARQADTTLAYSTFLSKHQNTEYSAQAKNSLVRLAYDAARREGSETAWMAFLREVPNSQHTSEANSRLRQIRFAEAKRLKTVQSYERFLATYPKGDDSAELSNALPGLRTWQKNKILGDLVIRMAPETSMSMSVSALGGVKVGPPKTETPDTRDADLAALKKHLDDGADPNQVRISGYEKAETKEIPGFPGLASTSFGSDGEPVPANEGGISLLSYCKSKGLDAAYELLKAHGAK